MVEALNGKTLDLGAKINNLQKASDVIAQNLMDMIYDGAFKPGEQLKQEEIAELFGVSRIPVRDALFHLIRINLAVNVPRKGIFVAPISKKTLKELFETRRILEGAACRLVFQRGNRMLVEQLQEIVARQEDLLVSAEINVQQAREIDSEFHKTLFSGTGNQVLSELIFANWMRIKQARSLSRIQPDSLKEWIGASIEGHRHVIEGLLSGDEERVYRTIIENIDRSEREVFEHLEAAGWLNEE